MNLWQYLKDRIILFLTDPETVYCGPGTYHWLNHEGKVILRSPQRIVGFGGGYNPVDYRQVNLLGIINTANTEQAYEAILNEPTKQAEARRQANAYYKWLQIETNKAHA